jgi:5-methylcytosine-specific restriction endonuclease McrBC GTP-binding regulatory subunit McrB
MVFGRYFAGSRNNVEIIQFHPSYSYEDFIEGIKPNLSETGEAKGFSRQSGLFKTLVERCLAYPDKDLVLIIDEINRGNISKIFGELIYLLEYRKEKISLTYSPKKEFAIPENLYIIGTMNSADRSIASLDYALRRRFYFIDFYPDIDILRGWFKGNPTKIDAEKVIGMLEQINEIIGAEVGKEYQIGQSYFMVKDLDEVKLKRIIGYAIMPLVRQYFFSKRQIVDKINAICKGTGTYMPQP